jgi:SAM-dependent methyltransferase
MLSCDREAIGESLNGSNEAQIEYWNGRTGAKWAALQVSLDAMLSPVTDELKARAGSVSGLRVLDVGCGTGETCAIWQAGGAEVTGVDVSAPMLAVAAERTKCKVRLVEADAATWNDASPFDLAVSRFGVMFFADPDAAFTAIASNVRPGGRLLFACWRPVAENQWVTVPMGAVRDLLPDPPPPVPHAPGPFALADGERLGGIVARAGFSEVAIEPFDFRVRLTNSGGLEEAVPLAMQVGPTGSALADVDRKTRALARQRIEAALAPHVHDGLVALGGAAWLVEAVRPAA